MSQAVLGKHYLWAIDARGRVCLCNSAARKWTTLPNSPDQPTVLAIWPTPDRVLVANARGTVTVYNAETADIIAEGHACQEPITVLHVDEMEDALFVGAESGMVCRLELSSLNFVTVMGEERMGHAASVLSFTRADEFLFSGGADASIFVWNLEDNSGTREICMTSRPVTSLLFVDKYLWVGEDDGTVEVLDIYGEDSDGISCVARKRVHSAPVKFLTRVGNLELWSAPGGHDLLYSKDDLENADDDSIAVWDLEDCSLIRRQASLPKTGLLGLLVRNRSAFEKVFLSVVDTKLSCTELTVNVDGNLSTPSVDAIQKYSAAVISNMEKDLAKVRDDMKYFQDNCTCDFSSMKTNGGFPNRDTDLIASQPTIIQASASSHGANSEQMLARTLSRQQKHSSNSQRLDEFHGALRGTLTRAESALSTLLSNPEPPCSVCARLGKKGMVDVQGVSRAANELASAINMLKLTEPEPGARLFNVSDPSFVALAAMPYFEEGTGGTAYPHAPSIRRPGSVDLSGKDFEVVKQERDVLAQDLQNLQQDSEKTILGLEQLLGIRVHKCNKLEEELQQAKVDKAALESAQNRVRELEHLVRQQLQHIESTVKSFEPRMNEHVEHAYLRMAADRNELTVLRRAKSELENQLSMTRSRNEALDLELGNSRTLVDTLKYEIQHATKELQLLREDKEDFSREIALLRMAATAHDSELEYTKSAMSKLRQAVDRMKLEIETHDLELERRDKIEKEQGERLEAAAEKVDSLKSEIIAIVEEKKNCDTEHSVELKSLQSSLSASKREVAKLARESGSTYKANRGLEKQVAELKTVVAKKAEELQRKLSEAEAICHERDTAQSSLQGIVVEKESLREERDGLKAQLLDVQEHNAGASGTPTGCTICNGPSAGVNVVPSTRSKHSFASSSWEIQGCGTDIELREALEAAAESTRCTQEVVKELASTAKAYKKAAAYHAKSQAAIFAVLKRTNVLSKRKTVSGAQLRPIVDGLLQILYQNPTENTSPSRSDVEPISVSRLLAGETEDSR